MKTALAPLRLLRPRALPEALVMLRDEGGGGTPLLPLAGGTDVYVGLNFGLPGRHARSAGFLNLWALRSSCGVRRRGQELHIGALTTFAELAASPLIARHAPTLAAAARTVGGVQIQNRATLGGNIVNASPAADAVPVLAVAEASLLIASARGSRTLPLADFFLDYRRTALADDELLIEVRLPAPARPTPGPFFRKVGTRAANAISKVVMAAVRGEPIRGRASPRIAFGSLGRTVLRVPQTEAVLAGGGSLAEAQEALLAEITPIDDLRSTAAYRRRVAANLLAQFWTETR
jgi:xanthine dehydrogenase small subunit